MLEKSFFMVKPDGLSRGLADEIFSRLETAGIKIIDKKIIHMTQEEAANLYAPHKGKAFYRGLIKFITSGPVVCSIIDGDNAIEKVRELMGDTDPRKALPGSIRHDFKEKNVLTPDGIIKNMVHGSDSPESAKREMAIFFKEG